MSFYAKQHVVLAILRDILRIPSLGIYFPSLGILKTSDGILFPSEKIGERTEKTEEYTLVSKFTEKKEEKFLRL